MKKQTIKNLKNVGIIIAIAIAIIIVGKYMGLFTGGISQQCGNTCADNYNQRVYPNCACYLDKDGDKIPDSIDPNPEVPNPPTDLEYPIDSDGDGFFDEEEIVAGTDPHNASDYPGVGTEATGYCQDSEEGAAYNVLLNKGYCQDNLGSHPETCEQSYVTELTCTSAGYLECQKTLESCDIFGYGYYCLDGRCVSPQTPSCTDADNGLNYASPATCQDTTHPTTTYSDNCYNTAKLNEYSCVNNVCTESTYTCPSGQCLNGVCLPQTDTDGDGYSDTEEQQAGSNPNDPNSTPVGGWAETCANQCKDTNYAGSAYKPSSSNNACQSYAYETCFPVFGLQYENSIYSSPCCCFDCVSW